MKILARMRVSAATTFWGIGAAIVGAVAIAWLAAQPLLLVFAGILFGTAWRGLATWIASRLGWPVGASLLACFFVFGALCAGAALWIVPRIDDRAAVLADQVLAAYHTLRERLAASDLGRYFSFDSSVFDQPVQYLRRAVGLALAVVGAVGATVLVAFIALYIAAAPEPYRRAILRITGPAHRERAAAVLDALARALRRWMLGRLVSMTVVGIATAIGLWLLGIPLPVTLGLIAGVFGFVPNIGPIASAVPALLLAGTIDAAHVLYVLALYLGINIADGYVLTPWVEKKAVSTPPALVISAQVVLGTLFGVLGLMMATPLIACAIVIVRMLYVEGVVERKSALLA